MKFGNELPGTILWASALVLVELAFLADQLDLVAQVVLLQLASPYLQCCPSFQATRSIQVVLPGLLYLADLSVQIVQVSLVVQEGQANHLLP